MKLFALDFSALILRFYFLMAIIIGSFFIHQPWLSIIALPVFISAMMGVKFITPRLIYRSRKAGQASDKAGHAPHTAYS